jgi:hypothetical protein
MYSVRILKSLDRLPFKICADSMWLDRRFDSPAHDCLVDAFRIGTEVSSSSQISIHLQQTTFALPSTIHLVHFRNFGMIEPTHCA